MTLLFIKGSGRSVKIAKHDPLFWFRKNVFAAFLCAAAVLLAPAVFAAGLEYTADSESASGTEWHDGSGAVNLWQMCCGRPGSYDYLTNDSANGGPSSARAGNYFLKLTRTSSQPLAPVANYGNRVEFTSAGFLQEKHMEERWLGFSMYVPGNFPNSGMGGWHSVFQWHDSGPLPAVVHGELLQNNEFQIFFRTYPNAPVPSPWWDFVQQQTVYSAPMPRDRWIDLVFNFRWDHRPNGSGFFKVWMDGELIVNYTGPIGFPTHSAGQNSTYFKFGSYADENKPFNRTLYYDEFRFGNSAATYEVVAPSGDPPGPRPNPPTFQ